MGSSNLVFVGISLGVFASMTGTLGKQLLRFSELQSLKGNAYPAKVALVVGLVFNTALGPIVDIFSYMFAPQSLIAPLAGLDVVWNTLLAPFTLGEKLTRMTVFGVALIALGATFTSIFGNHEDKDYTIDLLKSTFIRPAVAIYLGSLLVWVFFNVTMLQTRKANEAGELDPIRGLSLGLTAGSIAGNMFCAKGFIELLQASIRDSDGGIWAHWLPYLLLLGAVFFAVSNLYFLTTAMREYEALFMGAVFEGSLIVCACVSGIIVFKDLQDLATGNVVVYFTALSSIVCGILLVSLGSEKKVDEVDDVVWIEEDIKVESITSDIDLCSSPVTTYSDTLRTPYSTGNLNGTGKLNFNDTASSWNLAKEGLAQHVRKKERSNTVDSSPFPGQSAHKLDQIVSPLVSRVKLLGIRIHSADSFSSESGRRDSSPHSPTSPTPHANRRLHPSLWSPHPAQSPRTYRPASSPSPSNSHRTGQLDSHRPAHLVVETFGKTSSGVGISPPAPITSAVHIQSDNSIEIVADSSCDSSSEIHNEK